MKLTGDDMYGIELIAVIISWSLSLGNLIALIGIYRRYLALAKNLAVSVPEAKILR